MLIEATPRTRKDLASLLPRDEGQEAEQVAQRATRSTGALVPGPAGTTVRFQGMMVIGVLTSPLCSSSSWRSSVLALP